MKHELRVLVLLLLATVAHSTAVQSVRWLSYEPQTVELDGRLVTQSKFGPPNYGEQPKTDQKVKVPVLVLSETVNVLPDRSSDGPNNQYARDVRQIQLAFVEGETNHKDLIGQQVIVKGTLFHAHTGHHYTDVVMNVSSIERKPAGYDEQPFAVCSIFAFDLSSREGKPTSNSLVAEFLAPVSKQGVHKSFKLPTTELMINVVVQASARSGPGEFKPYAVGIALAVSEKEGNAVEASDRVLGGTYYTRDWNISVSRPVVVGETRYRVSLACRDRRKR